MRSLPLDLKESDTVNLALAKDNLTLADVVTREHNEQAYNAFRHKLEVQHTVHGTKNKPILLVWWGEYGK